MRKIATLGAGLVFALAPALALGQSGGSTTQPSAAIPDTTVNKAGAALHDVAEVQQKYQAKIQTAPPAQKQSLSTQANAEAVQAIQSHDLSVQEYTSVIRTAQNDPQLKQRLLSVANQDQ